MARTLRFPEGPLVFEMARGESLATHHKGLPGTLGGDRVVLGKWSTGFEKRAVEEAVLISPAFASRWLGYLNQSEHWSLDELTARWSDLARTQKRQVSFIVQISSFPRADLLQDGSGLEPGQGSLDLDRALVTYEKPISRGLDLSDSLTTTHTDARVEARITPLANLSSDHWRKLMEPWWVALAPSLAGMRPEFLKAPSRYDYCLGDYRTAFYLVEAPVSKEMECAPSLTLHLRNGDRERNARFVLREDPKPKATTNTRRKR